MNHLCGYVYNEKAIEEFLRESPMVCAAGDLPSGAGKDFFLFDIEKQLTGSVRAPHHQTIGDCVSHGSTGAAEDLQFVQILKNPGFKFAWLSSEVMYALARVQVGKGACGYDDGAIVAWAFTAGQRYGLVARGKYGDYDLTEYSASLAKQWGAPGAGCPQELVETAKSHVVLKCSPIQGPQKYEQARDVIFNGGAVVTGSNQLFGANRDREGFLSPGGNAGHCTYYRGFTDGSRRPGIFYMNSWGDNWPNGGAVQVTLESGRTVTLPAGGGLVDAQTFDRMHGGGDSEVWALWAEDGWLAPDDQVQFAF